MSEPLAPTLLYPNGGESVTTTELTVTWTAPVPVNSDGRDIVFELYYSDDYDPSDEPDWRQIAVVPGFTTQYVWRFGTALRTSKARVAIRTRNSRGERSGFSVSAGDFSIRRRQLTSPTIISPNPGERFDKYVEIVLDDSPIIGTHSQRSTYQFYYSSESAGVPSTSLAQNIPIGSDPVIWRTVDLPPAIDYVLQVFLSDDDGNRSDSVFIKNLAIAHEGFFIVDTVPPVGSIVINGNDTFTKSRNVTVEIMSYDDATAVHSMQLSDGTVKSKPLAVTDASQYQLSAGDAVKSVQLLLQDFGANRNNETLQRLFEKSVELENTEITDLAVDKTNSTLYAVTSGSFNYLYRYTTFPSLVTTFDDSCTAVAVFGDQVYVATASAGKKGTLYRYTGSETEKVADIGTTDSVVNAMTEHNGTLFIGLENGSVYTFDGLNLDKQTELPNPVRMLQSDNNLMYLVLENDNKIYIYNGTSFFDSGA